MAEETYYTVKQSSLTAVADAIREKGGTSESLSFPNGFVNAVGALSTSGGGSSQTMTTATVTLTTAGWSSDSGTQRVSVPGILSSSIVFVSPDPVIGNGYTAYINSKIRCYRQNNGSLDFLYYGSDNRPTIDINVNIVFVN